MLSSAQDIAITHINLEELWLSAQNLPKNHPVTVPAWAGEVYQGPTSS